MSLACLLAWVAVIVTLPVLLLLRATESRHTTIRRWRHQGQTWRTIADRLGVSPTTARRWALG